MQTVFSHIIQKRFSHANEDVATDALAYVLESSEAARRGMTKLLRGLVPDLPLLHFITQQAEGTIRPDMWGLADSELRVFVENKFWAGLTDNQPVSYLQQLAVCPQPTILLVVAPAAREHTLWRELKRRLLEAGIAASETAASVGVARSAKTELGPTLALTSWTNILSALEHEVVNDPGVLADLGQLRGLCDAADRNAFVPLSAMALSDQRTPAFILQLGSIVQGAVDCAVSENLLSVNALRPQASWDRIGRYVWVSGDRKAGAWFGIHLVLWKTHGVTPLWLFFEDTEFGRAQDVRRLIEPWAAANGIMTATINRAFAIAVDIPTGEEQSMVVRAIVDYIKPIAEILDVLPAKPAASAEAGGMEQ